MKNLFKENKKEFTGDHRKNYLTYNKSSIFPSDTKDNKTDKSLKKTYTKPFEPAFNDETSFKRKMKEFWNTKSDNVKERVSSIGFMTKEVKSFSNKLDSNPNTRISGRKFKSLYETNSISASRNILNKSVRERKVDSLQSNIFNDPAKDEMILRRNKSFHVNEGEKEVKIEKAKEEKKHNLTKCKSLGTSSNWLNSNTNNEMNKTDIKSTEPYSAQKMKKMSMISHFDSNEKVNMTLSTSPSKRDAEDKAKEKNLIKTLNTKYHSESKSKKMFQLSSTLQDKEYFNELVSKSNSIIILADRQDRDIKELRVEAKSGFDKLEAQELKYLFTKNGLHIYDIKENGKYHDGFKSGALTFKIRQSDDVKAYEIKLSEINTKILKMGLVLKGNELNIKKATSELMPTNVSWANAGFNKMANKRLPETKIENKRVKLTPSDKLSNHVIQSSIQYKNRYASTTSNLLSSLKANKS